jgi:Protein of unknown function (DUF4058)
MPIHNWDRVPSGLFHHFHQDWSVEIARALNRGRLPAGYSALVEQRSGPKEPDVLAIESNSEDGDTTASPGGTLTLERPKTQIVRRSTNEIYARRANRIVVKHRLGRIVAILEIVSPGNKDSRTALRDFVDKMVDSLRAGIHLLVIDLFSPTPRDPTGIHKAIWDHIVEEDFAFPPGKDRVLAAYEAGEERVAYVELVGVGDSLPDMPLIVSDGFHVMVPLEETYRTAWDASPLEFRRVVEEGDKR